MHRIKAAGLSYTEIPAVIRYTDYSRAKGQTGLGAVDIPLRAADGEAPPMIEHIHAYQWIFQLLFSALTAAVMFYFLIVTRTSALRRLFVVLFFGSGIVFIIDPDLTTDIANLVGIGRGADLVLYLTTLFLLFLCFNFRLRFLTVQDELTRVVREIALHNPVHEEDAVVRR